MPETIESIGVRIREIRLIRGLSLAELGNRAKVSAAQLSRIETGDRRATDSVLSAVAAALGVPVSVLHGQPYIKALQAERLDSLIAPISSALDTWDIPPDDVPPPGLDEVAARVTALARRRAAGEFGPIAAELPEVITDTGAAAAAASGPARERAHALIADVARTTTIVAYRLGYMGLARQALARMAAAAAQSDDPLQVAIERYERAVITHAEASRPDRGVALVRTALRELDGDDAQTRAVRGTLMLRASALSATMGDHDAAGDWLGQADDLARANRKADDEIPGARYALAFGDLNVQLGRVDMAIARDEYELAIAAADEIRWPESYQPTRIAGCLVRVASAQAWTARYEAALDTLHEAKAVAPQLVRYHPEVHETVGTLLRARQRAADPLREFAQWSGV